LSYDCQYGIVLGHCESSRALHVCVSNNALTCPISPFIPHLLQGLFRLAVGLMQTFATQHTDTNYSGLVNNLAKYFQIRDDYINLADEEYMKSKRYVSIN
jgi:hypothetical protein